MTEDGTDAVVVLSTAPDAEMALRLARGLVEPGLAACVNVVPGVRSIYRWEGKVQDDAELLLVVKTRRPLIQQVVERIRELHGYTCPEAIALPLVGGSVDYLRWLGEVTGS